MRNRLMSRRPGMTVHGSLAVKRDRKRDAALVVFSAGFLPCSRLDGGADPAHGLFGLIVLLIYAMIKKA